MADRPDTVRNDKGQIVSRSLESSKAKEMADARWSKEKTEGLSDLLSAIGYDDPKDAPADVRLLAEKALSSKAGNVTALTNLMKHRKVQLTKIHEETTEVKLDKTCPSCGLGPVERMVGHYLAPSVSSKVLEFLENNGDELLKLPKHAQKGKRS